VIYNSIYTKKLKLLKTYVIINNYIILLIIITIKYILILLVIMGNTLAKTLDNISNRLYYTAENLFDDYNDFIQNDEAFKIKDKDVNGGISTGSSSSETYTSGNDKIKIWYDISFVEILRGRTKLLTEWVEDFNIMKKSNNFKVSNNSAFTFSSEEQKEAFMKRRDVKKEDLTLNDLIQIYKIPNNVPYSESGKNALKKLKELLALHGFRGNKDIRKSLINLINLPEGRCTSGLRTFLDAIKPRQQNIISECDDDKKFSIKLSLSYKNPIHVKLYENAEAELEEKIKSEMLIPIKLKIADYMKEGDVILIKYEWKDINEEILNPEDYNGEQNINSEVFEWTIPKGFLSNYNIRDEIDFPKDEIPFETSLKIDRLWRRKYYSECRKIKDPPKIKKEYHLSFNIGDIDNFKVFINEMMSDFITYKNEMMSEGALLHYEL